MIWFFAHGAQLTGLNSPTATAGMSDGKLWIKTPLVRSSALSERLDAEVYLKIEVRLRVALLVLTTYNYDRRSKKVVRSR